MIYCMPFKPLGKY